MLRAWSGLHTRVLARDLRRDGTVPQYRSHRIRASHRVAAVPAVPKVSSFYGISIYIYRDDHNPPHVHAVYGGHEAWVVISNGVVLRGSLPPRALRLVRTWRVLASSLRPGTGRRRGRCPVALSHSHEGHESRSSRQGRRRAEATRPAALLRGRPGPGAGAHRRPSLRHHVRTTRRSG